MSLVPLALMSKLVINTDITERKTLQAQPLQAQKLDTFGLLAGGVAHDFNNLLTTINGFSEMILSGAIPAEKHRDCIREIYKAGERATSLTRQLLAFGRKQMLQPVVLDLNVLVSDMEKMLRRIIGEDIDLLSALDPALPRIKADPGQIEQVIMNMLVNARDAMPTGGHLSIETRAAGAGGQTPGQLAYSFRVPASVGALAQLRREVSAR